MAQMLARMERDGLIQRAPDPAGGRSSRVTLTESTSRSIATHPCIHCSDDAYVHIQMR